MNGDHMKIHLQKEATPHAIHRARTIPFSFQEETKECLLYMVQQGTIYPQRQTIRLVSPDDRNFKIKMRRQSLCGFTETNKQIIRLIYPTSTPTDAVTNIDSNSIFFTTVDAKHEY